MTQQPCRARGCTRPAHRQMLCQRHHHILITAGLEHLWPYRDQRVVVRRWADPIPRDQICAFCGGPYGVAVGTHERRLPGVCSTICSRSLRERLPVSVFVGKAVTRRWLTSGISMPHVTKRMTNDRNHQRSWH